MFLKKRLNAGFSTKFMVAFQKTEVLEKPLAIIYILIYTSEARHK
jgi:hypothetical protein